MAQAFFQLCAESRTGRDRASIQAVTGDVGLLVYLTQGLGQAVEAGVPT